MEILWDLQIINDIFPIYHIARLHRAARTDAIRAEVTNWLTVLAEKWKKRKAEAFLCIPLFVPGEITQPWQPRPDDHCSCRKPCKLCGA